MLSLIEMLIPPNLNRRRWPFFGLLSMKIVRLHLRRRHIQRHDFLRFQMHNPILVLDNALYLEKSFMQHHQWIAPHLFQQRVVQRLAVGD